VTLHHRGVEIEQCSHCQGIWLDRGELEQVLAGEPAQGFFGSLKRRWESGEGKRPCQAVTSGHVFSCAPDDDIHAALKTMRHAQVRRLPVVNVEGLLQGMLCLNDIVLRAEEARGKHVPAISYDEAMRTLKAICEHRATTGVAPA
jgi:CBS-domain-containing membrane protein